MRKFVIVLLLLGGCNPQETIFDGKRICLDKKHYTIFFDNEIPKEVRDKFDDDGPGEGLLKITYREKDPFYENLVAKWGKPENAPKHPSVSISLNQITESDVKSHQNHPWIRDAYFLENVYAEAHKETLENGFIKIADPILTIHWHIFRSNDKQKTYSQDLWIGHCARSSYGVMCEYSTIFDSNYLMTIRVPEQFIYHSSELASIVNRHVVENVFCKSKELSSMGVMEEEGNFLTSK